MVPDNQHFAESTRNLFTKTVNRRSCLIRRSLQHCTADAARSSWFLTTNTLQSQLGILSPKCLFASADPQHRIIRSEFNYPNLLSNHNDTHRARYRIGCDHASPALLRHLPGKLTLPSDGRECVWVDSSCRCTTRVNSSRSCYFRSTPTRRAIMLAQTQCSRLLCVFVYAHVRAAFDGLCSAAPTHTHTKKDRLEWQTIESACEDRDDDCLLYSVSTYHCSKFTELSSSESRVPSCTKDETLIQNGSAPISNAHMCVLPNTNHSRSCACHARIHCGKLRQNAAQPS